MADIHSTMASCIADLARAAAANNHIISDVVGQILGRSCNDLVWNQRKHGIYSSTSFEAWDCEQLYSINILTGTLLVDGLPLGRLPQQIVQHPEYKGVFGEANFEVTTFT